MKAKRRFTWLLCLVLIVAIPLGYAAAEEPADKTLTIGMSWAIKNDALFYGMDDSLTKATAEEAAKRGYEKVEWVHVVCDKNAQKQASDIEDLITQNVDLIVVYAQDSTAVGASIEAANAAGIPIICYDRDADAAVTQPDAFIGLDTVAQALYHGRRLVRGHGGLGRDANQRNLHCGRSR